MKDAIRDENSFRSVFRLLKGWLVFLFFHSQVAFATMQQDVEKIMGLIEQNKPFGHIQYSL